MCSPQAMALPLLVVRTLHVRRSISFRRLLPRVPQEVRFRLERASLRAILPTHYISAVLTRITSTQWEARGTFTFVELPERTRFFIECQLPPGLLVHQSR